MSDDISIRTDPAATRLRLLTASLVHTLPVRAGDGRKLGTVEQLVIDMGSGRTEYAVLSFGGFLGLGQKYHPIPFELLRASNDGEGYLVTIDHGLIDGSPGYRKDDAPLFDESYGQRLRSYYALPVRDRALF